MTPPGAGQPLVSIIVPCYNTGRYLNTAITSALRQANANVEVLVIDDGSTDNSAEVAHSFKDERLRYIYQENQGLSAARNTGMREARGAFFSFLDADDWLLPEKTETQVAFLQQHPEIGLVTGEYFRCDENGLELSRGCSVPGPVDRAELLVASLWHVCAAMVRREWAERVGPFDISLKAGEDWDYFCRLAIAGCRMEVLPGLVCAYRTLPGSMSSNYRQQTANMARVVEKSFSNPELPSSLAGLRAQALGRTFLLGAVRSYAGRDAAAGKEYLAEALVANPALQATAYREIMTMTLARALGHLAEPPDELLRRIFENLPDSLAPLRKKEDEALFFFRKARAFLFLKKGRHGHFVFGILSLALRQPALFLRYAMGKLPDPTRAL